MNEHQKKLKKLNHLNQRNKIQSVDKKSYIDFIKQSLADKSRKEIQINIAKILQTTQNKINNLIGSIITNIDINKGGVKHAVNKEAHNLKSKDLLYADEVINNADEISLSNKKHQDCEVLIFTKNINGEITFLAEVHASKDYLLIFDAWRRKAERSADATLVNNSSLTSPPGLTSETNLSPAVTNNLTPNGDKVNKNE